MINFPDSPTVGQTFTAPNGVFIWDGTKWAPEGITASGGGASVTISDTPPASPATGALWWNSSNGLFYIYYDDGTSKQWVDVNNLAIAGAAGPAGPAGATGPAGPAGPGVPAGGLAGQALTKNSSTDFDTSWQAPTPTCGRLSCTGNGNSVTSLQFLPFAGDRIKINGSIYAIPAAGIVGLANTNCYVNGVAGQSLAATTVYYVYCFNNGGTLTADFSTTGHATSATAGNVGVEIKSGDNTRTLIGIALTGANTNFYDTPQYRYTRTWFNRQRLTLDGGVLSGVTTTSGTAVNLGSTFFFVGWTGEALTATFSGFCANSVNPVSNYGGLWLDTLSGAVGNGAYWAISFANANYWGSFGINSVMTVPNELQHTIGAYGSVGAGTGSFYGSSTGILG